MKPSAILPDNINNVEINGQTLRKGAVAAFPANVNIIGNYRSGIYGSIKRHAQPGTCTGPAGCF